MSSRIHKQISASGQMDISVRVTSVAFDVFMGHYLQVLDIDKALAIVMRTQ